ncbi:hypothetical protein L1281_000164 [Neisseria sp. HSC-16F19]|nr:hypothetical protein [Neisseria sp. HSC-16F19]MCP2039599.1 hypothetical protein [Neisseria sp. HSC-16F19]
MNKTVVSTALAATLVLAACATPQNQTQTKIHNANKLRNVRHVCIIANPKQKEPAGLEQHIQASLKRYGISSEVVSANNRDRLYQSACRYNLRFKANGSRDIISNFNLLLRTPDHVVSQVYYVEGNEAVYRQQPDLQQQTDGIIARMLGRI